MKVETITFTNYRNIARAEIRFEDGVNLICGQNARGKTNVLEGIYSFARGKSFRASSERELVRFGAQGYNTELVYTDRHRTHSMTLGYADKKRLKKINGIPCDKISDMIGRFCAVLFCPEHLEIVKGGPGQRREFLNIAISQLDSRYILQQSRYKAALEERNALLRRLSFCDDPIQKKMLMTQLEIFSEQLSNAAAYICVTREDYVRRLSPYAEFFLGEMSRTKEKLKLEYECDIDRTCRDDEDACAVEYFKKLTQNVEREISAGATLYGIHRDDMKININRTDARAYASQGQQRSIALSLKMAEGELAREGLGEYPVFLYDDVLSELDDNRRCYLFSRTEGKQVIMTSCEYDDYQGSFRPSRIIKATSPGEFGFRLK